MISTIEREHPVIGWTDVMIHESEALTAEARLAMAIIEKWAMWCPDGEDSGGRQRMRLMTADEVSRRACDIAERTMEQIRHRGWTIEVPKPRAIR